MHDTGTSTGTLDSLTEADVSAWSAATQADPSCTFFQTPAWAQLVQHLGFGYRARPVIHHAGSSTIILPVIERPVLKGLTSKRECSVMGLYGGPVSEASPDRTAMEELVVAARLNSWAGGTISEVPRRPLDVASERTTRETHLIDLEQFDDEAELLRGYRKGHKSAVKKAMREGLSAEVASTTEEFEEFFTLYGETVARWDGDPAYSYARAFFAALAQASKSDRRIRLLVVKSEGKAIAGALVFHHGGHAAYWLGASNDEARRLQAGTLVVHGAIVDAFDQGRRVFDFLPSGGHDRVASFKRGFGVSAVPFDVHTFGNARSAQLLRSLIRRPL